MVAKGLLGLKEVEHNVWDELGSPDFSLALGTPAFDQTLVSEIRMVNVSKNVEEEIDDEEDNIPLT